MEPTNIVLSDVQKGLIAFFFGIVLLLHTLGIITASLNIILIILSLALIAYGFIKAGLYKKTILLFQRFKK